jgi:hypothetical protein
VLGLRHERRDNQGDAKRDFPEHGFQSAPMILFRASPAGVAPLRTAANGSKMVP